MTSFKEGNDVVEGEKKAAEEKIKDEPLEDDNNEEESSGPPPLDIFDMEVKIEQWEYILDRESRAFRKPKLPELSDEAIKKFLNPNIKSAKLTIFECPFCKRIFTYPLPFKSHLYSCESNKNVPNYILLCGKHPNCLFQSRKKQEIIAHFTKQHARLNKFVVNDDEEIEEDEDDEKNEGKDETIGGLDEEAAMVSEDPKCLSLTKKNQLKINQYFYVDRDEFKYTFGLCNEMHARNYRNLNALDKFYRFSQTSSAYTHDTIDLSRLKSTREASLRFQTSFSDSGRFDLKAFEAFQTSDDKDHFRLVNIVNQVTSMDWCPSYYERKSGKISQYLAVSTEPIENLLDDSSEKKVDHSSLLQIFSAPNLIHLFKSDELDSASSWSHSAIVNRKVGVVNLVKWRPDFGASRLRLGDRFVGYLLVAGSDGNGYVYLVEDFSKHASFRKDSDGNFIIRLH